MKDFLDFIRKQGVVGFAVAFILGGAVSSLVSSLIKDLVSPLLGIVLGVTGSFQTAYIQIGPAKLMIGSFISTLIDFIVVALVVYFGVKIIGVEKLDKKN
jgi:large conductance mechanosensitive channel